MRVTDKKLQEFEDYLLEKEMLICQEIAKDCTNDFYNGAFTWINAIRHEFKERFKDDERS